MQSKSKPVIVAFAVLSVLSWLAPSYGEELLFEDTFDELPAARAVARLAPS